MSCNIRSPMGDTGPPPTPNSKKVTLYRAPWAEDRVTAEAEGLMPLASFVRTLALKQEDTLLTLSDKCHHVNERGQDSNDHPAKGVFVLQFHGRLG